MKTHSRSTKRTREFRVGRLVMHGCNNAVICGATGEDARFVSGVRKKIERAIAASPKALGGGSGSILCIQCKAIVVNPNPEHRGLCHECRTSPTDVPEPTDSLPGSQARINVYANRVSNRQRMWHPLDAKLDNGVDCERLAGSRS